MTRSRSLHTIPKQTRLSSTSTSQEKKCTKCSETSVEYGSTSLIPELSRTLWSEDDDSLDFSLPWQPFFVSTTVSAPISADAAAVSRATFESENRDHVSHVRCEIIVAWGSIERRSANGTWPYWVLAIVPVYLSTRCHVILPRRFHEELRYRFCRIFSVRGAVYNGFGPFGVRARTRNATAY